MFFIINSPTHGRFKILIDKGDWEKIKIFKPYIHKVSHYFYARIDLPRKTSITVQRFILQPIPKGMVVDHINRNTLDNRRKNLRITTIQGNLQNQVRSNNKTGHTGVAFHKQTGRYTAQIKINYKKIHIGIFKTIKEAYEARKKAEQKYHYGLYATT
jgi:hypothetical protein